ncbi:WG repeat-containing protein [Flavobacterium subsaxonicum]|uniref:KWG repeat-containing protein n=1 Tax=Flavobacterium subsaxonicum WB 4.1-42 = DSM 21790 TaxID=1121898 RepID=A0A0A2N369_9FLAO|nr:WG repeat-containing protein [Flavobacterium subsaxonicum]KGO94905.1 hypothetical protein Q766_01965 [Flavobacterium subsaxonicum WB 4.1-42 = DSM 21790]
MKFILRLIILLASFQLSAQQLFKITENNRVGYINQKGTVVIKPIYRSGTDFANGIAAVRQDGLFGLIDTLGNYVVQPKYDYVSEFGNGMAEVRLNGKVQIINTKNEKVFDDQFLFTHNIDKDLFKVKTKSEKWGVYNTSTQKYVIDTIYDNIGDFIDGVAIADKSSKEEPTFSSSLLDINGKTIIASGKYNIEPFYNCVAKVTIKNSEGKYTYGAIDTKGKLLFTYDNKNHSYISSGFTNGLAVIHLYKYWIPEKKGVISTSEKAYEGYIDLKGNVVFNDTLFPYVNEFSNNRAFIKKKEGDYMMIDTNFKPIGNPLYNNILNKKFKDGYAIVEVNDSWGIIDTTGYFKVKPRFKEIAETGIIGNYFFYRYDSDDEYFYGVGNLDDKIILKPIMQDFDRTGFHNGLLKALVNNRLTYIDTNGNIVWQEKISTVQKNIPVNIDHKMRGYFYAYQSSDKKDYNGWAESENLPKKIRKQPFTKNQLSVIIDTKQDTIFAENYLGYKMYIANTTKSNTVFNAQDSRLNVTLQALDSNGNWNDIEYLPNSWCGNSYHTVILEPKEYWAFTIPKYEGALKTKIRAKVSCEDGKNSKVVYSNTIDGSVNPAQFYIEEAYTPNGLMDPYNN